MKVEFGNLWKLNKIKNRLIFLSTNVFLSNALVRILMYLIYNAVVIRVCTVHSPTKALF